MLSFAQAVQSRRIETMHPSLDRCHALSEPLCHLGTTHSLADHQEAVQAVVVPGILRTTYFRLNDLAAPVRIRHSQLSHVYALRFNGWHNTSRKNRCQITLQKL
jgi:hypothetical protein